MPHREPSAASDSFSLTRRLASFAHALSGVAFVLRTQHNAWIHALATTFVIGLAFALRIDVRDGCWLVLAAALVWVAEALNTALEALADAVHPDHHPLVGHAKDAAAGAVLIAAVAATIIGLIVLGPPLLRALG